MDVPKLPAPGDVVSVPLDVLPEFLEFHRLRIVSVSKSCVLEVKPVLEGDENEG